MNDAFDKQVRDALAKRQFEVDPDHRAAMEELLRRQDRRRPFIIWWAGAGLAGLALVAGLVVMRRPAATNGSDHAPSDSISTLKPQHQELESTIPVFDAPAPTVGEDESSSPSGAEASGSSIEITGGKVPTGSRPAMRPDRMTKAQATEKSVRSSPNEDNDRPAVRPGLTQVGGKAELISGDGPAMLPTTQGDTEQVASRSTQAASSDNALTEESALSFQEPVPAELIEVEPDMLLRERIAVLELESLPAIPLPIDLPVVQTDMDPVSGKPWYLFAEASGGIIARKGVTYPGGWSAAAGVGMGFSLVPRLEAVVSAGYWLQDGGFSFLRESTVREAGFGIRSSFHRLMPDRLHHAYVRAGIQYRIRRHLVSARAGLLYLYGAQGDIAVQVNDQITGQAAEKASYAWLSRDGLRLWKAQGELHYGYQLAPRMALTAGVLWRPGGIMRDDLSLASEGFSWKGQAASWQGLLSLQYRIHGNR